jgi:hypothetical protein
MKTVKRKKFIYIILAGLLILVLILVFGNKKGDSEETEIIDHKIVGEYYDDTCEVKFGYPKSWTKSNLILPLPQKPLSEATFNEPGKNSIFSYICYDAQNYSFSQFLTYNSFSSGGIENIDTGGVKWQRVGNFIYTTQKNKLIIFEMFFTKYDLNPGQGYEETF